MCAHALSTQGCHGFHPGVCQLCVWLCLGCRCGLVFNCVQCAVVTRVFSRGGAGLSWQRPAPPPAPPSAGAATATTTATCAPVLPLSSLARLQGWAPASGQPFEAVAVLGAGGAPPLTHDVPGLRWSAGHLAGFARAVRRRRVRDAGAVVVPPMRPVCAGLACGLPPGVGGRVGGSALGCDAHGPI